MNDKEKIRDLLSIEKWGNYYIERTPRVLEEASLADLRAFRVELTEFSYILEKEIRSRKSHLILNKDERAGVYELIRKLAEIELLLANQMVARQRDQDLLQEMEMHAFPETILIQERDFSTWSKSELSFPEDFLRILGNASDPGGR